MSKIYCGSGKLPKGHRLGSMIECLEKGKVNLYGLYKIDSKLIKQKVMSKKKASKKEKPLKEMEVRIKQAGLMGKLTTLNNDLKKLESSGKDDNETNNLIKNIKKHITFIQNESKKLSEMIKKIKDGKEIIMDLLTVDKSILEFEKENKLNKITPKKPTKKTSKKPTKKRATRK
jgi:hypothetical protein